MSHSLPMLGDAPRPAAPISLPLARKGFRPFFLLAALFAFSVLPIWMLAIGGFLDPSGYLDATYWHAHEMVFGFAVAVLAGFLLTAVGNWTGRETAVGGRLLALAGLWLAGRVAITCGGSLPRWIPAIADLSFLPVLVAVLARPILAANNKRNLVMLAILAALFFGNLAVHLDVLGVLPGGRRGGSLFGVDVVIFVILVIAGRVFPMFTRNGTGKDAIRSWPLFDTLTIVAMLALVVADVAAPASAVAATLAALTAAFASIRATHWGARHSLREPLLWILHVGYAWIPVGLLLRALAYFGAFAPGALATHALTAGAIGALTLGMMSRVSLGHTGRTMVAPRLATVSFVLVTFAAIVRVAAPFVHPASYRLSLFVSGMAWSIAFGLYVVGYAPILLGARADGKAG
jgi:uncharacterized protein involved in response to NO